MKIIVGLGNPGKKYQHNRHNIGFHCIDHIAILHKASLKKSHCQSDIGRAVINDAEVLLVKPRTFVNLSGDAVSCLLKKYRADLSDLIVIYDDLDLPAGRIRLRSGGGSGGHRGIQSIIERTGSPDFQRVRIGISRPPPGSCQLNEDDVIEYVLGDFPDTEKEIMQQAIERAAEAAVCLITEGMEMAMNRFNRRK